MASRNAVQVFAELSNGYAGMDGDVRGVDRSSRGCSKVAPGFGSYLRTGLPSIAASGPSCLPRFQHSMPASSCFNPSPISDETHKLYYYITITSSLIVASMASFDINYPGTGGSAPTRVDSMSPTMAMNSARQVATGTTAGTAAHSSKPLNMCNAEGAKKEARREEELDKYYGYLAGGRYVGVAGKTASGRQQNSDTTTAAATTTTTTLSDRLLSNESYSQHYKVRRS